jgi:glycosyltransferase involved in cell wall biosynthesis
MSGPRTSVIICTRDREASFQRALASVLLQDTGGFEIVVVDGSDPPVELPAGIDIPIRLLRDERRGEGSARAAGLAAARGELIAWCDDDDAWSPGHLRTLREALLGRPGWDLVFADPGGRFSRATAGMVVAGASEWMAPPGFRLRASDVLHEKRAAEAVGGFDRSLRAYAAGDLFSRIFAAGQVHDIPFLLTTHHAVPGAVTPADREVALERLRTDWDRTQAGAWFSAQRLAERAGAVTPFNPDTWRDGRRELIFDTTMSGPWSFTLIAKALIPHLQQLGVTVTLGPMREQGIDPGWESVAGPLEPQDKLGLVYDWNNGGASLRCERVVLFPSWETTFVPRWQIEEINRTVTMLYVSCWENVRIAREYGIEPPVRVLHYGIEPRQFPRLDRDRRDDGPFTFGSSGQFLFRKGIDVLIRAFQAEFELHEPVRLALKHSYGPRDFPAPDDPRIVLSTEFRDDVGVLDFLRTLDVFVLPSRGEAFGLTGLEAMATGLPLIATNWGGPVEYLDPADSYPLNFRLEDVGGALVGDRRRWGQWAEPDVDHLRSLLRHLYEHRDEAAAAGRRASERVHRDWSWERVAAQFVADFDLLAKGLTPT